MEELNPVLTSFLLAHVDLETQRHQNLLTPDDPEANSYLNGLDVLAVPDAVERLTVELQERAERLDHRLASVMVHHVDLVWLLLAIAF